MARAAPFTPVSRVVVALLAVFVSDAALALSAKVTTSTAETRNGVVVPRPTGKVSSDDLPINLNSTQTLGPVVPSGGNAGTQLATITFSTAALFEADPGDASGATLCLSYRFSSTAAASVVAATASVGVGLGHPTGSTMSSATQPVTVVVPSPATLTVTPLVGPVRTIFTVGPEATVVSSGGVAVSVVRFGTFDVQAGDVVDFDVLNAVVARAESPTGAADVSPQSMSYSLSAGCSVTPVPALSGHTLAALGVLLALLTALAGGFNVLRRARR